jgi:flagellin-like protein
MLDEISLDSGVSPVVGVILMVAVTVILSTVVGLFATGLSDNTQENAKAGVSISDNGDGSVDVQAISIDRSDEIRVLVDGTQQATITDAGGTSTVPGGAITVVGVLDEEKTVLQTVPETETSTPPETVSGTVSINPVIPGATVKAIDTDGSVIASTTTDSNGEYELSGSNISNASILVTVEGFTNNITNNPLYTSASLSASTDSPVSVDFDETTVTDTTVNGNSVSVIHRGAGTSSNPHTIGNVHQLQAINHSDATRNDSYELVTDINASATTNWNNGAGFEPIGTYDSEFNGNLDGNNHAVDSLVIDRPEIYDSGLIGILGGGTVENVAVTNADISGRKSVGGLVGLNNRGTVENSSVTGQVSGDGNGVGGLVGNNLGTVSNSSASGTVSGGKFVGGLVGRHYEGTVKNSFATGDVSSGGQVGGLLGRFDEGNVTDSYWDKQATGQTTSEGGGTGLTTSEMQGDSATSNMTGFDFTNVWQTVEGDYPELRE